MPSIFIAKPQVACSVRLKDRQLQQHTITLLRKLARDQGLNVSSLTEKWELVHVIVEHRLYGAKKHSQDVTDAMQRTIFDLPGEIRNMIYSYILVEDGPITTSYGLGIAKGAYSSSKNKQLCTTTKSQKPKTTNGAIAQLRNMSRTNRELRKEVRSYFFTNNQFHVRIFERTSYAKFIDDIRSDGRANITSIRFDAHYRSTVGRLLLTCPNLHNLEVSMTMSNILDVDSYNLLRKFVSSRREEMHEVSRIIKLSSRMSALVSLPSLRSFQLNCKGSFVAGGSRNSQDISRLQNLRSIVYAAILARMEDIVASKHVCVMICKFGRSKLYNKGCSRSTSTSA